MPFLRVYEVRMTGRIEGSTRPITAHTISYEGDVSVRNNLSGDMSIIQSRIFVFCVSD